MSTHKTIKILQAAVVMVSLVLAGIIEAQGLDASSDNFPVIGGTYEVQDPVAYTGGTFDAEIVSMSLTGNAMSSPISLSSQGGGLWHIDSFFDVFTELSIDGGPLIVDSFFDVFFDITVEIGQDQTTGSFDTEIVAMELSGMIPGAISIMIRESPSLASIGNLTITDIGGGLYHIDSFFDVFTELSVDGGQTWLVADGPMRMELTPEPVTLLLLGLGGLALRLRRR